MLAHGCSVDSRDRPFQPSDWVDVNLEVPNTPQASLNTTAPSMETPINVNSTSPSGFPIPLNIVPIPPPRRRKKSTIRPLPPAPDDRTDVSQFCNIEPLYTSVFPKIPDYSNIRNEKHQHKYGKEIYDNKANRIEKSLSSKLVPGWRSVEKVSSHLEWPESYSNRPKNTSSVSLPNYGELETFKPDVYSEEESAFGGHSSFQHNPNVSNTERIQSNVIIKEHNKNAKVDHPFNTIRHLTLGWGNTSTPVKRSSEELRNLTAIGGWILHADRCARFSDPQSDEGCRHMPNGNTAELVPSLLSYAANFTFPERLILSDTDSICNLKNKKRSNSLDCHQKFESKKLHKRTLSSENEPFDIFDDKLSSIEPIFQHDSALKLLTKSISEESFPSALLEDADEDDFLDDKIVKDTKNEITKIREELEAVKNEVGTPPPSPEPIIKPELQLSEHSLQLNMLKEEADESNLSSMTPSLTELEAALSDMLEKEEDQEMFSTHTSEDNCKPSVIMKHLSKSVEPSIVPLITAGTPVCIGIHLNRSTDDNSPQTDDTFVNDSGSSTASTSKNQVGAPEKPRRVDRISLHSAHLFGDIPIPPRRRNRCKSNSPGDTCTPNCHQ